MCRASFAELSAAVLAASDVHAAGFAYLDFAAAHPRRYRVMFGAADLAEPALRLFPRVLAGSPAEALTLWLDLHRLADQRSSIRSLQFPALASRLITSLS